MIPVVLFTYRRPDLLERTLGALAREPVPLLIAYSDGPGDPSDETAIAAVRRLLRAVDWCPVRVIERRANLGLGRSVITGVTEVLARYEAVLVTEDDLVVAPGTYQYLAAALRHYAGDKRVMSVTGWTHPRITPPALGTQPYFDGKGECWIWGTWARAWLGMQRPAMDVMRECAGRGVDIERYGSDMPKLAAEAGPRNLWAVTWWYHHMLHGGLCLRPPHTLSEHLGWDDRATTTVPAAAVWRNPPLQLVPPVPRAWPDPAEHPDCPRLWRAAIGDRQ